MKYYYCCCCCLCNLFLVIAISSSSTQGQQLQSERNCRFTLNNTLGELEIKFPFRLSNQSESCGYEGFELYYENNSVMFMLPYDPQPLLVRHISYGLQQLSVSDPDGCIFTRLLQLNLSASPFRLVRNPADYYFAWYGFYDYNGHDNYYYCYYYNLQYYMDNDSRDPCYKALKCSSPASGSAFDPAGPAHCMSQLPIGYDYYWANSTLSSKDFSSHKCEVMTSNKFIISTDKQEFLLTWDWPDCTQCFRNCSFNKRSNRTECVESPPTHDYTAASHASQRDPAIGHHAIGPYLAVAVVVATVIILVPVLSKLSKMQKNKQNAKIEAFLKEYKSTKPTRYSLSELRKMTDNFRTKLGQGGYGNVCKGKLPNGVPIAVKVLDNPTLSGEEFTNEIGTIGRIHHVNIVCLLGFCVEGSTRALIYEFMPNESLDKHIFKEDASGASIFSWVKMLDMATSIARGIEYLHQGCDEQILHLDIKPHNILLDRDFNPKISDFGLAKLCSKEKSAVTMTAVRGTVGYIAPEVLLGSNKTVSHKSDVYSFGMLLLEMIGGSKDKDTDDDKAQSYFPERVYNHLKQGEELRLAGRSTQEMEIARKLAIIALWCVQWRPVNRPSMKQVILMLKESTESLTLPPNPFVSQFGENNMNYDTQEIIDDDDLERENNMIMESDNDQIV